MCWAFENTGENAVSDCADCGTSDLGQQLDALVRRARPNSAQAIAMATKILEVSGLAGTLVLQVPAKPTDPTEATLTVGSVRVVLDPVQVAANAGLPEAKRSR